MDRIKYRKETNPELVQAAVKAYAEAPPVTFGGWHQLARQLQGTSSDPETLAEKVARADQRAA